MTIIHGNFWRSQSSARYAFWPSRSKMSPGPAPKPHRKKKKKHSDIARSDWSSFLSMILSHHHYFSVTTDIHQRSQTSYTICIPLISKMITMGLWTNIVLNMLKELLDKHAPLVEKTAIVSPNAPWYSDELRSAKQTKRRAERKY